jgi:OmpA-OmpF porin, OOP family
MKKIFPLLSLFLVFLSSTFSQNAVSKWALELSGGTGHFVAESKHYFFGGLGIDRYLSNTMDLSLQATYGKYRFTGEFDNLLTGTKTDASLLLRYKMNNGSFLPEKSIVAPFLTAGAGVASCTGDSASTGQRLIIPVGGGVKVRLTSYISVQYQLLFNLNYDYNSESQSVFFMKHSIGLVINLGSSNKYKSHCHCLD